MGALLNPLVANKLARICGMFGSEHDGERASAALKADQLVRGAGLRWNDIIPSLPSPESLPELCGWLLAHREALNDWEFAFVSTIRAPLSVKQKNKLDQIAAKVRAMGAV
jgi:hypothetical protein